MFKSALPADHIRQLLEVNLDLLCYPILKKKNRILSVVGFTIGSPPVSVTTLTTAGSSPLIAYGTINIFVSNVQLFVITIYEYLLLVKIRFDFVLIYTK